VSRLKLAAYAVIAVLLLLYFIPASVFGAGRGPAIITLGGPPEGAGSGSAPTALLAGASQVNVTPFGCPPGIATFAVNPLWNSDPDWTGPITTVGLWGEEFTDTNGNGRYDVWEPCVDDPRNTALDAGSAGKWDGIYLAGFGSGRAATGVADPIWVRTLVLRSGDLTVAWAVLDTIACSSAQVPRVRSFLAEAAPELKVDVIILTAVHNHEGPDTVGLWGPDDFTDGKFPLYLEYVDRKIAQSVALAARDLVPVTVTYGRSTRGPTRTWPASVPQQLAHAVVLRR